MYENKAKNAFEVGEFNEFYRKHDVLEQFLRILGAEIEEEKIFVYFTVYRRIVLLALRYCLVEVIKFAHKVFKCNDCCAERKKKKKVLKCSLNSFKPSSTPALHIWNHFSCIDFANSFGSIHIIF